MEIKKVTSSSNQCIRFLPLGDSYTIGEGIEREFNWPHLLAQKLQQEGKKIKILAEPAVTGYTTQDLIDHELYLVDQLKPDLVSVMIGVNDWVQDVKSEKFKGNLKSICEKILKKISNESFFLIDIPDFGVTREGHKYSKGRNISDGIFEYNKIIDSVGTAYNVKVVSVFESSKKMANLDYVAEDGLHPSAKMYEEWAKMVCNYF